MTARKILRAVSLPIAVLIVHAIAFANNAYVSHPWIDIPMHFAGGLAAAFMVYCLLRIAENKNKLKTTIYLKFLFVISIVSLIAVGWEFMEFTFDSLISSNFQMGIADTTGDLFMGLLGAPVGYLLGKIFG